MEADVMPASLARTIVVATVLGVAFWTGIGYVLFA